MSNNNRFTIDFGQVERDVKELREIASAIRSMSRKKMETIQSGVNAAWKGDKATSYQKKLSGYQGDLMKLADKIDGMADAYERKAQAFKKAEEFGQSIMDFRSYLRV